MHTCSALLHFLTTSKLVCLIPYAACHLPLSTCDCLLPQSPCPPANFVLLLTISHAKSNEQFMGFMSVPLEDAFLCFTFLFVLLFRASMPICFVCFYFYYLVNVVTALHHVLIEQNNSELLGGNIHFLWYQSTNRPFTAISSKYFYLHRYHQLVCYRCCWWSTQIFSIAWRDCIDKTLQHARIIYERSA